MANPEDKKNKGSLRLWLGLLLIVGVLLAGFLAWTPPLPSFQGKTVYEWMFETRSSHLPSNPGLNAIGSNAVPYLARALAMRRTPYDRYRIVRDPRVQKFLKQLGFGFRWTKPGKEIRDRATWSLLALGFEATPALPELHAELLNPEAADRQMVIACIAEIGPPPESVPLLVRAWPLTTNEIYVIRHDLLHTLGHAGTNAFELARPLALQALADPNADVRIVGANALENWGQPAPEAVQQLVSLLSSTNCLLAAAAAGALGRVTNRAEAAIPALRVLLSSTNAYARAVAAVTCWRLGGDAEETRLILESLLRSSHKGTAANYLGSMGLKAQASVPALLRASHQDIGAWVDMYDRALCARAVLRIQGQSPEAVGVLAEALVFKQNPWVRATVADDIGRLGSAAVTLIPALEDALHDGDREVRHEAANALGRLKGVGR